MALALSSSSPALVEKWLTGGVLGGGVRTSAYYVV